MMMRRRRRIGLKLSGVIWLVIAVVVSSPCSARAQEEAEEEGGWHVIVAGALQHRRRSADSDVTYFDFNQGFAAGGGVGYHFGPLGFDGEFTYLRNAADIVATPATGPLDGLGHVALAAYLGNLRFTFPARGRFSPYLAAGFGGLKSYQHHVSNSAALRAGLEADGANDGLVFAYQFRAGASVRVTERVELLVGYRYLRAGELLFMDTALGDLRPDGVKVHHLEGGVRMAF
jgi:opacity protein-like surface antigen